MNNTVKFKHPKDKCEIIMFPSMSSNNVSEKPVAANNKKKGKKSEVYPLRIDDLKKMLSYFVEKEMWIYYLLFVISANMARRVGDTLSLTWEHLFDPKTGKIRENLMEIVEDKTNKIANPIINAPCRDAIALYIEKTGCNPAKNGYKDPVFLQLSGTHRGNILTSDSYRKVLKAAALDIGIEYNVGTHSTRKSFGMINRMLHPHDCNCMVKLQKIFNHSDIETTEAYIGLTKEMIEEYYYEYGVFFDEYIIEGKEYKAVAETPIVSLDTGDLRDIIRAAYEAGRENANTNNAMDHVDAINDIMAMIEGLQK